uniref:Uncharacterized protein n=1 Tax=Pseudonaja textilis TaxID=8673 RepID=A0A670Y5Z9_PSETE
MLRAKWGLMLPAHPPSGNWHYQFRILLLGDSTVGKTSLLLESFLSLSPQMVYFPVSNTVPKQFWLQLLYVK